MRTIVSKQSNPKSFTSFKSNNINKNAGSILIRDVPHVQNPTPKATDEKSNHRHWVKQLKSRKQKIDENINIYHYPLQGNEDTNPDDDTNTDTGNKMPEDDTNNPFDEDHFLQAQSGGMHLYSINNDKVQNIDMKYSTTNLFLEEEWLKSYTKTNDLKSVREISLSLNVNQTAIEDIGHLLPNLYFLSLSNSYLESIRDLGVFLSNLKELDLSNCSLDILEGMSSLPNLESLNLSYNNLSDVTPLALHDSLVVLNLSYNKIASLSCLEMLSTCPLLEHLTLDGNSIISIPKYRLVVLHMVPTLMTLDGLKLNREEQKSLLEVTNYSKILEEAEEYLLDLVKQEKFRSQHDEIKESYKAFDFSQGTETASPLSPHVADEIVFRNVLYAKHSHLKRGLVTTSPSREPSKTSTTSSSLENCEVDNTDSLLTMGTNEFFAGGFRRRKNKFEKKTDETKEAKSNSEDNLEWSGTILEVLDNPHKNIHFPGHNSTMNTPDIYNDTQSTAVDTLYEQFEKIDLANSDTLLQKSSKEKINALSDNTNMEPELKKECRGRRKKVHKDRSTARLKDTVPASTTKQNKGKKNNTLPCPLIDDDATREPSFSSDRRPDSRRGRRQNQYEDSEEKDKYSYGEYMRAHNSNLYANRPCSAKREEKANLDFSMDEDIFTEVRNTIRTISRAGQNRDSSSRQFRNIPSRGSMTFSSLSENSVRRNLDENENREKTDVFDSSEGSSDVKPATFRIRNFLDSSSDEDDDMIDRKIDKEILQMKQSKSKIVGKKNVDWEDEEDSYTSDKQNSYQTFGFNLKESLDAIDKWIEDEDNDNMSCPSNNNKISTSFAILQPRRRKENTKESEGEQSTGSNESPKIGARKNIEENLKSPPKPPLSLKHSVSAFNLDRKKNILKKR